MWRLAANELTDNCVYDARKINFIGSIKAQVTGVWIRGQRVDAAYFSSRTRPIFRSGSARYVLFIQMSKEMWHFETEGNGEILFNKMINGFLPELFKRWRRANAHHLVSIVLFTRIFYDKDSPQGIIHEGEELSSIVREGKEYTYRDFFRVVVSNRASDDWTIILHQLKKEFFVFLKDVLVQPKSSDSPGTAKVGEEEFVSTRSSPSVIYSKSSMESSDTNHIIVGEPSSSVHGNVLEAIAMACGQFSRDHVDRDLIRTGISIIIITPGTGQFVVDENMLQITTDNLIANGIGIDLVCLARPPLHSVPLFRYETERAIGRSSLESTRPRSVSVADPQSPSQLRSPTAQERRFSGALMLSRFPLIRQNSASSIENRSLAGPTANIEDESSKEWIYAIPHWIDISFWSTSLERKSRHHREQAVVQSRVSNVTGNSRKYQKSIKSAFMARCKMYELQMMGIMENEVIAISIPYLHETPIYAPLPVPVNGKKLSGLSSEQITEHKESHSRSALIENAKEKYREEGRLAEKFMAEYDDTAFKSLADLNQAISNAKSRRLNEDQRQIDKLVKEDPDVLGTSFRSTQSGRPQAVPGKSGYFDRKMRERRPSLESPTDIENKEKDLSASGAYVSATSNTRSGIPPLARQISFGVRGAFPIPKANASSALFMNSGTITTRGFTPAAVTAETSLKASSSKAFQESSGRIRKGSMGAMSVKYVLDESDKSYLNNSRSGTISPGASPSTARPINIKSGGGSSDLDASTIFTGISKDMTMQMSRQSTILREGKPNRINERGQINMLKTASQARLAAPRLDLTQSAGQMSATPTKLNPSSALLPWVTLLNPSNPKSLPLNPKNQFGRWQHVFPRPLRATTIKWKSLCSPAALPLTTEYFPSAEQLLNEYEESPYVIAQNDDDDVEEISRNRKELVREMVSQRLARGFQVVVGTAIQEVNTHRIGEPDIFAMSYMTKAGSSIFMSMGPHIHQLICDEEFNVEVKRYTRKPTSLSNNTSGLLPIKYTACIRTVSSGSYNPKVTLFKIPTLDYNWNYVDRYLGGYEEDFTEQMKFWRARFVLIPVEPLSLGSKKAAQTVGPNEDLNDEENRLEGIKKITQLFQRYRYVPPEERRYQRSRAKVKDLNPLEIIFKTDDPSVLVARELEPLALLDNDHTSQREHIFTRPEMFDRSTIKLSQLAQELQSPRGVRLQDRRWHLRLHYNCFIGSELVTWMLENFKDIENREDAVEYGNDLMKDGLFQHVERRHIFRDGNFFYQLQSDYSTPRPISRGGWFGGRSKPSNAESIDSPIAEKLSRSRSNSTATEDSIATTSGRLSEKKRKLKVELSKVMRYNLDPNKRSYRPEIINLHYDRLHNPDNCYHIRIEWLNVTSKLIEDALTSWAKTIHRYGLKLVEAPIDETWSIANSNPFRSPATISLARPPPKPSPKYELSNFSTTFTPLSRSDPFLYQKAVLRHFSFVLDLEAAKNFPNDADVTYSWGKPSYKYSQYIHRSGIIFAQITDEGNFLLLANRLYTSRTAGSDRFDPTNAERMPSQHSNTGYRAGQSASSIGAAQSFSISGLANNSSVSTNAGYSSIDLYITAEMIKEEVLAFCQDSQRLQSFYDEVNASSLNPMTPQMGPLSIRSSSIVPAAVESIPTSPGGFLLGASNFSPVSMSMASRPRVTSIVEKMSIEDSTDTTLSD